MRQAHKKGLFRLLNGNRKQVKGRPKFDAKKSGHAQEKKDVW